MAKYIINKDWGQDQRYEIEANGVKDEGGFVDFYDGSGLVFRIQKERVFTVERSGARQ